MKLDNLFRFLSAAHWSYLVDSRAPERGGVFLVAGPNNLKSNILEWSLESVKGNGALIYSDLTLKQLAVIRSEISAGKHHTLGFPELEKLYARNPQVAANLEGVLKAMVAEGFSHFAFEDQRLAVQKARCFVLAAVLESVYRARGSAWQENGFLRRFVCVKYTLSVKARAKLNEAILRGERLAFPPVLFLPSSPIKDETTRDEAKKLQTIIGDDEAYMQLNLMRKCLVIMKWHHKQQNGHKRKGQLTPMECIEDVSEAIRPQGWGILDV